MRLFKRQLLESIAGWDIIAARGLQELESSSSSGYLGSFDRDGLELSVTCTDWGSLPHCRHGPGTASRDLPHGNPRRSLRFPFLFGSVVSHPNVYSLLQLLFEITPLLSSSL